MFVYAEGGLKSTLGIISQPLSTIFFETKSGPGTRGAPVWLGWLPMNPRGISLPLPSQRWDYKGVAMASFLHRDCN